MTPMMIKAEPNHHAINFKTDNHIPPIIKINDEKPNALAEPYLEVARNMTMANVIIAIPQNKPEVTVEA